MTINNESEIEKLKTEILNLKRDQEKYRVLYETSADALMTAKGPDWKFTSGNPSAIKLFNTQTEEKFISLSPRDLSPEKQPDGKLSSTKSIEMMEIALKNGSHYFDWTHKAYKGEKFEATVLLTLVEINDERFLQATVRDVSSQKETERKLKESEDGFKKAQRMAKVGSWEWDVGVDEVTWSEELFRMTGMDSQLPAPSFKEQEKMWLPDSWKKLNELVQETIKFGTPYNVELEMYASDKSIMNLITIGEAIKNNDGDIVGLRGTVQNITELNKSKIVLLEKIEELEILNKITINRELKMIELKKEIEKLKSEK
jgi:PAS domain S-box-containing protein